jgi:hypothetical protein
MRGGSLLAKSPRHLDSLAQRLPQVGTKTTGNKRSLTFSVSAGGPSRYEDEVGGLSAASVRASAWLTEAAAAGTELEPGHGWIRGLEQPRRQQPW